MKRNASDNFPIEAEVLALVVDDVARSSQEENNGDYGFDRLYAGTIRIAP